MPPACSWIHAAASAAHISHQPAATAAGQQVIRPPGPAACLPPCLTQHLCPSSAPHTARLPLFFNPPADPLPLPPLLQDKMDVDAVKDNKRKAADEEAPAAKKQKLENGSAAAVEANPNESDTLFVGNMSWNSSEDSLREFFDGCGEIVNIRIGERTCCVLGLRAGQAAASCCAGDTASCELHAVGGTCIYCAPGTSLYHACATLPSPLATSPACPHPADTSPPPPPFPAAYRDDGKPKGFCHVQFDSVASAKAGLGKKGEELDGRVLNLDMSAPRQQRDFTPRDNGYSQQERPAREPRESDGRTIFVKGFDK
jgi:RNA recognition motif-containing protein